MSIIRFDASQFQPAVALEPLPTGWYVGYMSASELKPNSANTGAYLETEYTILSPAQFAGRKLYDRLNLQNPNPTAVEIAHRTLSAICHAVGVIQVEDSAVLHNRPLQIKAFLKPASIGSDGKAYEANNEVKGYKAIEHAAPAPQPQFAAPPPAQYAPPQPPQFAPPQPQQQPVQQQRPQPPQFAAPPFAQPQPAPAPQPPQFAPPQPQQFAAPQPQQQPQQQPPAFAQPAPTPATQPMDATTPPWLR